MASSIFKGPSTARRTAPGPTEHNSEVVIFNGNPMDLLPAPLVTIENVDDPSLWGNQVQ